MGEEEEGKVYSIIKFLKDIQELKEHSSRNYTGRALVTYANNDRYEGEFKDGLREGTGLYTYFKEEGQPNTYEGEWLQNKKHGIGKMIFVGFGEYFGRFENGKRHGEGVFKYYKSGNIYSGSWKYGEKNGHGEFIFNDTKMKIAGNWDKGKLTEGKWIFPNGTYFEGPFVNNYPKGEGVWHFVNGNYVKGDFSQKENTEAEPDAEGGEEASGPNMLINWLTNPEVADPTRVVKVEDIKVELPPEEEEEEKEDEVKEEEKKEEEKKEEEVPNEEAKNEE